MYILLCNDGSYYTGSTIDLDVRYAQHLAGEGAKHTKKHPPVAIAYVEEYPRIDHAFYREKQVQGWSRKKKEALINGEFDKLPELAKAYRDVKPGLRVPQPPVSLPQTPVPSDPLAEALEANGSEGTDNKMPIV